MNNFSSHQGRYAILGFVLYGGCTLIVQLTVLQELLIVFAGYELFLGFSLASWMYWIGTGSWLAHRKAYTNLPRLIPWLIPLLIINIQVIRLSKLLFGFGMLVGLLPMLILTVILLAPVGLVTGVLFSWGCAWANERCNLSIASAYFWEAIGAAIGGITFSAYIAGRFTADWIVAFLSIPVTLIALRLIAKNSSRNRRLTVIAASLGVFLAFGWAASPLAHMSRAAQWRGYELIEERVSRYSHLVLAKIKTGSLMSYFDGGVLAAHFPDPAAYEELTHWPLLTHPNPQHILVIGNAATGTLTEILKHPIRQIDFVELDTAVIELLEPVLSSEDRASLRDARVNIIYQDGRRFLEKSGRLYDIILLQLPEPNNAQINRLYTLEAFQAASNRLAPGGIFAFAIPSSENYLSPQTAYFNACLYRTFKEAFEHVELIAGDPLLLMGSSKPIIFNLQKLIARYNQRRLLTRVVVPSYMPIKLDPHRRQKLLTVLETTPNVPLNRDFYPVCYAYAWRVWFSKFVSPVYFLGSLILLAILAWMFIFTWKRRRTLTQRPQTMALFCMGAAGLIYETILILAFQAINGYVYWQLGALFAAFMLGLALGSGFIVRFIPTIDPSRSYRMLRMILLIAGAQGISAVWILPGFQRLSPEAPHLLLFGLAMLLTALWVGMAFPLASRLSSSGSDSNDSITRQAGHLYAADLWGAALGATFTSAALVPLLGLTFTACLAGGLLLLAALLLPSIPRTP